MQALSNSGNENSLLTGGNIEQTLAHGGRPSALTSWVERERDRAEPKPALIISYIKEEGFKSILKCAESVILTDPNWMMGPLKRSLITAGSAPHSACRDSRYHK